jgi:hypothetical protein
MIEQLIVFALVCVLLTPIMWLWVRGIDYMQENHPDYKGDDLFGNFEEDKIKD